MFSLFLALSLLVSVTLALPAPSRRFSARYNDELNFGKRRALNVKRGTVDGMIGLGDNSDLLYTVPITLGNTTTVVNLDTGSSDLWVISSDCATHACAKAASSLTTRVPTQGLTKVGPTVTMRYGDSTTGTYATGPIAESTISIAGIAMQNQLFAAINDTSNSVVEFGAAGIFGLGFPSESQIQAAAVAHQFGSSATTDHLIASSYADGPVISRITQSEALEMPMFTISLQRSTIDISGKGVLTLGALPPGVDNSSLTWVPVRLYTQAEGGLPSPTFAPNEVYPLRWEIDIDGVFLDGVELPASTIPTTGGVSATSMSALIDTGNSILRGPSDVVQNILGKISPNYNPQKSNSATLACAQAHNLAFKIGGQMFPIDPRDLPSPVSSNDAKDCVIDNLVATDAPGIGALFRWSLGDPFMKSNLVAFHYGNLTHPSQDPPRIGFLSQVPTNAAALLTQAVQEASLDGGNFESTLVIAPTLSAELQAETETTVVASAASLEAAELTATHAVAAASITPANAQATTTGAVSSVPTGQTTKKSQAYRLKLWDPWLLMLCAALGTLLF